MSQMELDRFLLVSTGIGLLLAAATLVHQLFFGDASAPKSLVIAKKKHMSNASPVLAKFLKQQSHFLLGFSLMALGDWLQGPYLFSMYESASVSRAAQLDLYSFDFLLGAVLSVVVGVYSDLGGRKRSCALYGLFYGLSCLCNHFPSHFSILALGCAVDGLCNALLRCAFESYWAETARRTLGSMTGTEDMKKKKKNSKEDEPVADSWISHTLALSQWAGTVCSLVAGLACHACVHFVGKWWAAGSSSSAASVENIKFTATMDLAALVLFVGGIYVWIYWEEDGGDTNKTAAITETGGAGGAEEDKMGFVSVLRKALSTLPIRTKASFCIFFLEVCAEAALLIFICLYPSLLHSVFEKTNQGGAALSSSSSSSSSSSLSAAPFGVIFTQLMAALAVGSYWYSYSLSSAQEGETSTLRTTLRALQWSSFAFAGSVGVLMLASVMDKASLPVEDASVVTIVVMVAMWVFEVAAGVYLSALGAIHEKTMSSDVRASSVGIVRMLSYVVAWVAVSLYRFVPSSSRKHSFAAPEEVLAWVVCCGVSVCFYLCSVFGLVFVMSEEDDAKKRN